MKRIKYSIFVVLLVTVLACEKDETKVIMLDNPVVPTIKTMPDLTLKRSEGTKVLTFTGTPVDPGFRASANYFLEISKTGNNFADAVILLSDIQDTSMKITVTDLNAGLLKKFTPDQINSVDFRIRAVLVVEAGTGAPGTSTKPFEYNSATKTVNATPFGLPRLDLINSGITQKIESPLGDGKYIGYVKLDATKSFTIKDPDSNTTYGGTNGVLSANGAGLKATINGWHRLTVDTKTLTYELKEFRIGLIGSSTPNGWSAPDSKMDFDASLGAFTIKLDLVVGAVKFRANDDWNNGIINLGIGDADHPEYTLNNLWNSGSSKDIPIAAAGNYTINLFFKSSGYSCTITKN